MVTGDSHPEEQRHWRTSIVGYEPAADPASLTAHPANARTHDNAQRHAIAATLDAVGWVAPVIVNRRNGRILDGHARVELAQAAGETVPVAWVDLDDVAEQTVLATFDPLGFMAGYDEGALTDLLVQVGGMQDDLDRMLASLAGLELSEPIELADVVSPGPASTGSEAYAGAPAAPNPNPVDEGFSMGAVGVRAIILTYDVPTYEAVIEALSRVAGDTNADKIRSLLGVD